jgi:hypothetical protein
MPRFVTMWRVKGYDVVLRNRCVSQRTVKVYQLYSSYSSVRPSASKSVQTRYGREPRYLSGIELGYGLDDRWFESQQGLGVFLLTAASRTALGPTQPPIHRVPESLSVGVKRPGREADHLPPSSAEVKNAWSYTSPPPYASMAWC